MSEINDDELMIDDDGKKLAISINCLAQRFVKLV